MMIKRCGNPDIIHHTNTAGNEHKHGHKSDNFHMVAHYSFFQGMPKWPSDKTHLTYSFPSAVPVIGLEELRSIISRAFQKWADVSQFTFEETTGGAQADLRIGFYRSDHGDGFPFDGPGNVLAHAFQPEIVHEIGHLLGLGHSMDRNAIMFSEIPAGTVKRELNQDDINGIRALYS
ncbi:hypothetical protein Pint_02753 [Pistacia integerrima]|uniref:Uncharacterized protein n=1 Tax=Pistacia integerrima TaxID=434235 RepID=A0ACC0ZP65_9ROSI|nr:hypothetical protein Pint_02753 [Pistacia integerrima]